MGLRDSILTKPREASGAAAANRFDFQKSWASWKQFELRESPHDYVLILLEWREDVMVFLFDQTGAASAECFQIRTKTFHLPRWGLTELLKRENKVAPGTGKTKGKKTAKPKLVPGLSIIGKMYHEHLGQLSVGAVAPLKGDIDWFWRPATLEDGEVAILLPMRWSALEQVGVTILDIGDPTFKPVGVTYGGFTDSPGVSERLSNGFRLSVLTPSLSAEILAQVVAEPLTDDEMVH